MAWRALTRREPIHRCGRRWRRRARGMQRLVDVLTPAAARGTCDGRRNERGALTSYWRVCSRIRLRLSTRLRRSRRRMRRWRLWTAARVPTRLLRLRSRRIWSFCVRIAVWSPGWAWTSAWRRWRRRRSFVGVVDGREGWLDARYRHRFVWTTWDRDFKILIVSAHYPVWAGVWRGE